MQHQENPYIVPRCDRDIGILYQDSDVLVIEKPDLLLSIPGKHPLNNDSVLSRLRTLYPSANLVHRLDLDTSGILIAALSKTSHAHISKQFAARSVDKQYTAVLFGIVENDHGEIDLPIIADWPKRPLQKICWQEGKPSRTQYQVLHRDYDKNQSRVCFTPITGRTHQLRIHSREFGHPILGCDMYAHDQAFKQAPRLLLHASSIQFDNPVSGERISIESPAPF